MGVVIDGTTYLALAEVAQLIGISRQTLWRWRREEAVPLGKRFRNRQVLFDEADIRAIREYANRLEPAQL
jgi:predicted DNA-binding transcriptional regulator AlpA